jgi:hypothetical protein
MAVRRQRVQVDNDPLSLFLSQSTLEDNEEDAEEIPEKCEAKPEPKASRLINSLAPEKPIEYEPIPPVKVPIIHESIKVETQKEIQKEKILPSVTPTPVAATAPRPVPAPVVPQAALKQEHHIVKPPAVPTSIFETEDDIFLKKAPQKKEDDFFGTDGELSELKFISTKAKSSPVKLEENDSDEDDKVLILTPLSVLSVCLSVSLSFLLTFPLILVGRSCCW